MDLVDHLDVNKITTTTTVSSSPVYALAVSMGTVLMKTLMSYLQFRLYLVDSFLENPFLLWKKSDIRRLHQFGRFLPILTKSKLRAVGGRMSTTAPHPRTKMWYLFFYSLNLLYIFLFVNK